MKYILFIGCQIPSRVPQYEIAARAVMEHIGIGLEDERQFNCCGYPMRDANEKSYLLSSVRNLALAERSGLDMLVLCKCCLGSLKKAEDLMKHQGKLQAEIRDILKREKLEYTGKVQIKHLLSILDEHVGAVTIKTKLKKTYKDLKIATHYGCHALRPHTITQFDDPVAPTIFDRLVEITGAKSIDWNYKLECCGSHAMGINDELSMALTGRKLDSSLKAGADFICTACPYCQIQFDTVQKHMISGNGSEKGIPSILYPQLLGVCLGIKEELLGIDMNLINIRNIRSFLSEE